MKMIQSKLIAAALLLGGLNANAQVKFPVTNNDLRNNLSRIITDYANGFTALRGDTIEIDPQTIEFSSKLQFNGAQQNSIVEYRSPKPVYSWKAVLLSTEDFEEASKNTNGCSAS